MMRTLFISFAAAASALAVASPASAQWGQPPVQGYGYGYGHDNYGQVRALQARVEQLRQRIHQLDRRNRLSNGESRRLDRHAINLQRRIQTAAYRGLNRREHMEIEHRIEALRQAIRYESRDGGRWGWNGQNSYNNGYGYYGARVRADDRRGDRDDDRRGRYDDDDRDGRGDRDGRRGDRDDD